MQSGSVQVIDWQLGYHLVVGVPNQTCVPSGNVTLPEIFLPPMMTYVLSSFAVGVGCGSAAVV